MIFDGAVTICHRKDLWYFRPMWTARAGFYVGGEPLYVVSDGSTAHDRASALRSALQASRTTVAGIPTREEWKQRLKPQLKAAGVTSWKKFFIKGEVAEFMVEMLNGGLRFTPNYYSGKDRGYHGVRELAVTLPADASDDEIDATLKKMVSLFEWRD